MSYEEFGPPDGFCVDCGEPTEADHHWYCPDCFAEQNGWRERRDRERAGADAVTAIGQAFAPCACCAARRLLFPHGTERLCMNCLTYLKRRAA